MEPRASSPALLLGGLLAAAIGVVIAIRCPAPTTLGLPHLQEMRLGNDALMDVGGAFLGLRRLTADVAWIQLLQYYGTPEAHPSSQPAEPHTPHLHFDYGSGRYERFFELSQRVVRLDSAFISAYLYGAGALAWNLNRMDEAIALLHEGIQRNPQAWQFHKYLAAIGYKQRGERSKVIETLEVAVRDPACPSMIKNILGNTYKDEGRYGEALGVFVDLYERGEDVWYRDTALKQIRLLSRRLNLPEPQ